MKKIALFIANGSEEMEAITQKSVLERGGLSVDIITIGGEEVVTAHGVKITGDYTLSNMEKDAYDCFILPGGVKGTENFKSSRDLLELLNEKFHENKLICAICAAPTALYEAGVLKGKNYTCYEGFNEDIKDATYLREGVVVDGNVITGRGPYYSLPFAAKILEELTDRKNADEVLDKMLKDR